MSTQWEQPTHLQQPPKRKRGCLIAAIAAIVFGLLVAGCIAVVASNSSDDGTTKTTTPKAKNARIGQEASDGKFTFVVKKFSCDSNTCRAQVVVENTANEPQYVDATEQLLFDTKDRQFKADVSASSDNLFINQLNPGTSVEGTVVWKVPSNFKAKYIELHDSVFSNGIRVDV